MRGTRFLFVAFVLSLVGPAASAQAPAAPAPAPVAPSIKLSGYVQVRSDIQDGTGLSTSIDHARIAATGGLARGLSWRLFTEFRTGAPGGGKATVSLLDAYVRYQPGIWAVQAGQFKVPFTREFLTALSEVETVDRSAVTNALAPKWDVGLMGEIGAGRAATLVAGVFNGDGMNTIANADSTLLGAARLSVRALPSLTLGADAATWLGDSLRYGADASWVTERVTLRAEYLRQHRDSLAGEDHGWYGLAAVRATEMVELIGRYEEFDRPALDGKRRGWTGGTNLYFANRRVRLAVEYTRRTPAGGAGKGLFTTQLQARF